MKIVKSVKQIKTKDRDNEVQLKDVPCGDIFYAGLDACLDPGFYIKGLKHNGSDTDYPCIQLGSGLNNRLHESATVQPFPKGVFVMGEED